MNSHALINRPIQFPMDFCSVEIERGRQCQVSLQKFIDLQYFDDFAEEITRESEKRTMRFSQCTQNNIT